MKIIIKNKENVNQANKVYVNEIDFDSMTVEHQLEWIEKVLDKKELKSTFLKVLNTHDFDITKVEDGLELFKK